MIIGLLGQAGAGKDTTADFLVKNHNFVKVALADPLKRIARDVFAFTDEQLFGPSHRRNEPDKRYPRDGRYMYPAAPAGSLWYPIGGGRTLIDEADIAVLMKDLWCVNEKEEGKKTAYVRMAGSSKKLHQALLGEAPEGCIIDHINGDGLDNRRANLRFCTHAQNRQNQSKRIDGASPFKGVGWVEDRKKWRAFIKVDGQQKTLGYFEREEEAALAYDAAAATAFGAFARTNSSMFLTPRYALQRLGSEWGRDCYPNVWIDYALRVAKTLMDPEWDCLYTAKDGLFDEQRRHAEGPYSGVVISDVRFKNEVAAIKAAGGLVWKIERPSAGLTGAAAAHMSETEQLEIPHDEFFCMIKNDMSLKSLEDLTTQAFKLSKKQLVQTSEE